MDYLTSTSSKRVSFFVGPLNEMATNRPAGCTGLQTMAYTLQGGTHATGPRYSGEMFVNKETVTNPTFPTSQSEAFQESEGGIPNPLYEIVQPVIDEGIVTNPPYPVSQQGTFAHDEGVTFENRAATMLMPMPMPMPMPTIIYQPSNPGSVTTYQ